MLNRQTITDYDRRIWLKSLTNQLYIHIRRQFMVPKKTKVNNNLVFGCTSICKIVRTTTMNYYYTTYRINLFRLYNILISSNWRRKSHVTMPRKNKPPVEGLIIRIVTLDSCVIMRQCILICPSLEKLHTHLKVFFHSGT